MYEKVVDHEKKIMNAEKKRMIVIVMMVKIVDYYFVQVLMWIWGQNEVAMMYPPKDQDGNQDNSTDKVVRKMADIHSFAVEMHKMQLLQHIVADSKPIQHIPCWNIPKQKVPSCWLAQANV